MVKEKQSCSSSRKPPFFSIPNLKPLLPTYNNIPKPIIDPPETPSNPFLNPNPHCVEFPENRLSPMDVDLCLAASRSEEIVTRTTDLTATEHAGVPLSEPTLVSTTSESPANSEVAASQTVKDKIVTKIDCKNAGWIICDVCNVTCNSEKVFKKHKEGKTHTKNTQKLNVSSTSKQETPSLVVDETSDQESEKKNQGLVSSPSKQETPSLVVDEITSDQESEKKNQHLVSSSIKQETQSLVATDNLDQESEVKNQNLLQNEGSVHSLFVCSIPDSGCDYQKIATEQCGYLTRQVTGPSYKPTSVSATMALPSNGRAQKGHAKLDAQQPLWCDVCKVGCSGNKCFEKHILGKLHLKNLEISEKTITSSMHTTPVKPPVEDLMSTDSEIGDSDDHKTAWCEICKIKFPTSNDIIRHVSGKRHKKKLQNLANLPSNLIASVTTPPNDPAAEKPMLMNGEVVNSNKGNATWCELCEILCTSLDQLNEHIKGKKHQKNLKNKEKLFGDGPTLVTKRALNKKGKVVHSEEGSKRKGALAIEEDADTNKRQKMMMMMMKEEEACTVACKACNVVCKGLMAFKTHLAGAEHSEVVLKQATGGGSSKQHT